MQQVSSLDPKSSDPKLDQLIPESECLPNPCTAGMGDPEAGDKMLRWGKEVSETKVTPDQDRKEVQGAKQSVPDRRSGRGAE